MGNDVVVVDEVVVVTGSVVVVVMIVVVVDVVINWSSMVDVVDWSFKSTVLNEISWLSFVLQQTNTRKKSKTLFKIIFLIY